MKNILSSSALASRLRLLKLEPRMLFDGAALAEGLIAAESAEPRPAAATRANEPVRDAEAEALLAEAPSQSSTPDAAATRQEDDNALLAQTSGTTEESDSDADSTTPLTSDEGGSTTDAAVTDTTSETTSNDGTAQTGTDADDNATGDENEATAVDGAYTQLLIVDARVDNHENLLVDVPPGVTVRIVAADEDGLAVISSELAAQPGYSAIHIVSHGSSGSFTLGRDTVDSASLANHASTLEGWAGFLTEDADILLYGCDIGAGAEGQQFLTELAHLTRADIAASSDATGSAELGGNWVLEVQTGTIEAGAVLSTLATEGYASLLAATAVVDANAAGTRTTSEDTPLVISGVAVNGDSPSDVITLSIVTSGGISTLGTVAGLTFTGTNGTNSFSVSGTIANVNAALATLSFNPEENQNSSTAGYTPSIALSVTAGGAGSVLIDNIAVTAVNDAPDLSTQAPLAVLEGGSGALSLDQLAISAEALDPDIATGQQVIDQQMMEIRSLPSQGTLTYRGGAVAVGMVIPVTELGNLIYTHDGTDLTVQGADSFEVTVHDGGGGETEGTIGITIDPVNVDPVIIDADIRIIEGQVAVVAPSIDLGDAADLPADAVVTISNVQPNGQGVLFLDTNNDGIADPSEIITGTITLTVAELNLLKFAHNGSEPNAPGAVAPSYDISVQDTGGGTGTPSNTISTTVTIEVQPNNDDPTLHNEHGTPADAYFLDAGDSRIVPITAGMLQLSDVDRNPSDLSQTTPPNQLVYTVGTPAVYGELQLFVGGTAGPDGDGWVVLGSGGRFTQADIDNDHLRYVHRVATVGDTPDAFTFTARDSAFGFDVITDPQNPVSGREGGVRAPGDPTGPIAINSFNILIQDLPGYGDILRTPLPLDYDFIDVGTSSNTGSIWDEGIDNAYVITTAMLEYRITRTEQGSGIIQDVPANETVYTLENQPSNGVVQHLVGGVWTDIPLNGQFTQEDIDNGHIRFVHDGSEDHTTSFDYRVSDGTANSVSGNFGIDVTPTNDRPVADGGTGQVNEGTGNAVRIGTDVIGMSDPDLSLDPAKQLAGEGAADYLWFQITSLPDHGTLERWNGTAWETVDTTTWLPSSVLTAAADGGTSGLRYVHDGSEPLAYAGGPFVNFTYLVRDDLGDPGDSLATNVTPPLLTDGSVASNQSDTGTARINIIPVNDPPQIADTPGATDPTIGGTIPGGGALTGANEILQNVPEGGSMVITSAHLTAVDPDNTTVQRQYRITQVPTLGHILLNGNVLGVGSTFTQADIDANRVSYRHGGAEVDALTTGFGAQYHDKFHFVVNDGVAQDSGNGADNNVFLITLTPTNDKPTVAVPTGPIDIDSTDPANNLIPGVSVDDPDLANGVLPGVESDFVQVTVRLLDALGNPVDHGAIPGGVNIGYGTPADTSGLWNVTGSGVNSILQIQGTRAQVNEALASLSVTFGDDLNQRFQLQVIVDDRTRDASGALDTSGSDANGGELNQGTTPGSAPTAVPGTNYDWSSQATLPADDPNITAATVEIRASHTNEPVVFTGPPTITVNEDVRTPISGFTVSDPESDAFGLPVTVTVSVPVDQGTLHIDPATGPVTITGNNTRSITLTGTAADIEALLNSNLSYLTAQDMNHDANGGAGGDVSLTLTFNDGAAAIGGDTGSGSQSENPADIVTAITITAVNDAPTVAAGTGGLTVSDTLPVPVPGFVVNDVDANDGYVDGEEDGVIQVVVRLLDDSGNPLSQDAYSTATGQGIRIDSSAAGHGATVDATHNGAYGALELRGTRDQINAYLAGLQLTFENLGSSNLDTTYRVEVVADDRLRDVASGALTGGANGGSTNQETGVPAVPTTDTFDPYVTTVTGYDIFNVASNTRNLFISSVNDPGQITANDVVVDEGSATLVLDASNANITLNDPDDNGATTMVVTVTVGIGTISGVGGAGGSVTGEGTSTITITGATEAEINSRLQALTITFPDPDGAGPATGADWNGSFDVTVVYDDRGNTGTRPGSLVGDTDNPRDGYGDYDYADGTSNNLVTTRIFTVSVNPVNDAPTTDTGSPVTIDVPPETEDTDGTSNTIGSLLGSTFSDPRDDVGGTPALPGLPGGSTPDGFAGVAVTGNTSIPGQGAWEYSTDGGTTWTALPPVSETTAFLIGVNDQIRFNPAPDFHGTPGDLTVRLVDDHAGPITTGDTADVSGANSGGSTPYSNADNAVTLSTTVTNVNDRPTGTDAALANTTEDATGQPGDTIDNLFGPGYSDANDDQTGITGGADASTPLGGIAIVGNAADPLTEGVWEYNTGSGWVGVGSPTGTSALVLPPTAGLRFVPVANYNGTPGGLTLHLADSAQTFGSGVDISGTLGPTSTWSEAVTLDTVVDPVNDAPGWTHTPTDPTAAENTDGTGVPPVNLLNPGTVSDVDLSTTPGLDSATFGGGTITVTLTDGIAGDYLQINPAVTAGIAGVTGGTGSTPLIITLTDTATLAEVEAILAAVQFGHTTNNPTVFGTDLTRSYTVELADGNNDQAGGDAGGPGSLSAPIISGTISFDTHDDPPVATDDVNTVDEDSGIPATGNVITDGTPDSDPDTPVTDLRVNGIRTGTEGAGGPSSPVTGPTVIVGQYGTLTINPDGSYSYVLDDSNPDVDALATGQTLEEVFTYTLTDGTSTDQAQLTITINGNSNPVVSIPDLNGGEPGNHSIPEDATTPVSGTVAISHPGGDAQIDQLTVNVGGGTTTIDRTDLDNLASGTPIVIVGEEGTLTLTGYDTTTGVVTYSYQQSGTNKDHSAGPYSVQDTFTFEVTDLGGNTSIPRDLVITITDTAPEALPDTNTVAEGVGRAPTSTSGNVFGPAGASPGDVADRLGADPASVVGIGAGTSTGHLSGNLGAPFGGVYGTITLNADGSYTYVLDNNNPLVQRLNNGQTLTEVFRYTIRDSDGNESTTTLTITITGVTDNPVRPPAPTAPVAPPAAGPAPEAPQGPRHVQDLPRNEIRFARLDIDHIADRLRPTLYVLPAVEEAQDIVPGQFGNIDRVRDIMDPSLYVLPAVEASHRATRDAAQPAIDRFNDSDTDDDGFIIESAPAEETPQAQEAAPAASEPPATRAAADAQEPAQPVARVEFAEQVRQWAGAHSIRQRAAEFDLLFEAPPQAPAAPAATADTPRQAADTPQA